MKSSIKRKFSKAWLKFNTVIVQSTEAVTRGVLLKKLFLRFRNIYRKTLASEPIINEFKGLKACNVIKKDLNTGTFLWILHFLFSFFITISHLCSIMRHVLIVILFIKQNMLILYCLELTLCVTKASHVLKNHLIFFFWIFIIDSFLVLEVLYERNCSTKRAAQLITAVDFVHGVRTGFSGRQMLIFVRF